MKIARKNWGFFQSQKLFRMVETFSPFSRILMCRPSRRDLSGSAETSPPHGVYDTMTAIHITSVIS